MLSTRAAGGICLRYVAYYPSHTRQSRAIKKLKSKGSEHQFPFERLHESPPQDSMLSYQLMYSAVRLLKGVVLLPIP